jgi:hypothetical protein
MASVEEIVYSFQVCASQSESVFVCEREERASVREGDSAR